MSEPSAYILEIEWDQGVDLPRLVGPFPTLSEAEGWGRLNIPNGTWNAAVLSWPYARPASDQRAAS